MGLKHFTLRTLSLVVVGLAMASSASAATSLLAKIKGKVVAGEGYQIVLIDGAGKVTLKELSPSGDFTVGTKKLANSTLALLDPDGRALGPVVLGVNKGKLKAYLGFSGKLPSGKSTINLGNIELRTGFGQPVKKVPTALIKKSGVLVADTDGDGNPVGAATGGISATAAGSGVRIRAGGDSGGGGSGLASAGRDSDADGIIDALDPDVDGDGIANVADEDFAGNDDATFSSLVLDYRNTLNANIGAVTDDDIDNAIGGANGFSIGFWSSLPGNSAITGGHVICSDTNGYCNATTGTAVYGGLTESDPAVRGQLWRDLNADGSNYPNLELLNLSGGKAIAAAIEPRLGTSAVRPGDTYLVNFTSGSGASRRVVENKLLVLSPYMVTVPALKSYTVGGTTTTINYADIDNQPGNHGNPITTDGAGTITLTYWRPQRLLYRSETPASETDRYRDMGHLRYGMVFEGGNRQFTCAGNYSNISSDLTETPDGLGTDSSPFADQGAELYPLRDAADDATPSDTRTIAFTIDLRACLTRAGQAVGDYTIRIIARGEELSGGANSSSQMFRVRVQ